MEDNVAEPTMRRVYWRLIPILFLAVFLNYLDRINIGFAALEMNQQLGFSAAVFGFGASVFFVGYMLLEVPSNMILHRVGARVWIGRIMISWGLVAAAFAFVRSDVSFYVLRFLLGIAEAGFLPGLALYVTLWFPVRWRARAVASYIAGGQIAAVVGGPLSGLLLDHADGFFGLQSWQVMFLVEGFPAVLLGIMFFFILTDTPDKASWLREDQRRWLSETLDAERATIDAAHGRHFALRDVFKDGRVWSLALLFGSALVGIYGMLIWLPQIIKSMGNLNNTEVGLLSAVPPLLGTAGALIVGWSSDRTGDRKYHLAASYAVACLGLAGSAVFAHDDVVAYLCLCVAGLGLYSGTPLFWSLNASLMTGAALAASIALVNTLAQFGGLVGPWMIGLVKTSTGSFSIALLVLSAFLLLAALIALFFRVGPPAADARTVGRASAEAL